MIPYFALIFIPPIYSIWLMLFKQRDSVSDRFVITKRNNSTIPAFFVLLLALLVFRDKSIGRDLPTYEYLFRRYEMYDLQQIVQSWDEVLYHAYFWLMHQISDNFQFLMAVTAIITVLPIAWVYCEDKSHGYLKIILFVNMSTFIMLFSGLRQSMAMAAGMLAYRCVRSKKKGPFLVWSLIAALLHHSGFMVFFMYPLYHMRIRRKHIILIIAVIAVVYLFNVQIFGTATDLIGYSERFEGVVEGGTGAFGSLALFSLFAVFAFFITNERVATKEVIGLRNFLVFSVALQCFAPLHYIAMRMNYYYILFIPITMGKCISCARKEYRNIAKVAETVICLFFTIMFVYSTYRSYVTGISTLDTIPYKFLWE